LRVLAAAVTAASRALHGWRLSGAARSPEKPRSHAGSGSGTGSERGRPMRASEASHAPNDWRQSSGSKSRAKRSRRGWRLGTVRWRLTRWTKQPA